MQPEKINIHGASGHAKVVAEVIESTGNEIGEIFDDNVNIDSFLGKSVKHIYDGSFPIIVAIGDCKIRKRIVEHIESQFSNAIHPSAIISKSSVIGTGSVIMAGAVIQSEAAIGNHCIVNTQSSVGHECHISDFVHIASGTTVCGNCRMGWCWKRCKTRHKNREKLYDWSRFCRCERYSRQRRRIW